MIKRFLKTLGILIILMNESQHEIRAKQILTKSFINQIIISFVTNSNVSSQYISFREEKSSNGMKDHLDFFV